MKQNLRTSEEIETILNSLNNLKKAEMPAFFNTRLQAKLLRKKQPSWLQQVFATTTKPVYAFATLFVFVVLNITTISVLLKDKKIFTQNNTQDTTIENFAADYNLSSSSFYNESKPVQ